MRAESGTTSIRPRTWSGCGSTSDRQAKPLLGTRAPRCVAWPKLRRWRNQQRRVSTRLVGVRASDPLTRRAALSTPGEDDHGAAETAARHARAVDVFVGLRQLDQPVDVRDRDFEVVAHRVVRGAEQFAKARQVGALERGYGLEHSLVFGDDVSRAATQWVGQTLHAREVGMCQVAQLRYPKLACGLFALRAARVVVASRNLVRHARMNDHQVRLS